MKRRLSHILLLSSVATFPPALAEPPATEQVALAARAPAVEVRPRPAGRPFLDLPELEYSFDVVARCNDDWIAESLSLNVADSHVVLDAGQLSDSENRQISLKIPARQLAPVAVHDFCTLAETVTPPGQAPAGMTGSSPVTVKAVLSAQTSLLCRNEEERRITYVSKPLDVTLICQVPEPAAD